MPDTPSLADKFRTKLTNEAESRKEWSTENMAFICPACLALVSTLSQKELTKLFDEIFDNAIPAVVNNDNLRAMANNEARYAVSRLLDVKGRSQTLPHINVKYIFTPDGKVKKEIAEKFGLLPKKDEGKEGDGAAAHEDYTLAKLLDADSASKSNQAQQIINMVKETAAMIGKLVTPQIGALVVEKDLLYPGNNRTHTIQDAAKPIFQSMKKSYMPLVTTYTMMSIIPDFQVAEQEFIYKLTICKRDLRQGKPAKVSIKPDGIITGVSSPGAVSF